MRYEVVHPSELGPWEIARWRALVDADPALRNPFLTAGYAMAVGRIRRDARIVIIHQGRDIDGFLPVQRTSPFAAMPLGAPLTDCQALIGRADLEPSAKGLCRALRVGRIDFSGMLVHQAAFAGAAKGRAGSWIAEVGFGPDAYVEALRAKRHETVRQQDKKLRKLKREQPEVIFTPMSRERTHLEQLLAWKQDHCRRTRQPPVWSTPWVLRLVDEIWENESSDLRPGLFTLTIGGRLAAANFFLAGEVTLHDWIISHDDAFAPYSPGVLLTRMVCEWAAENGFVEVELGPGDYLYKRQLATTQRDLAWGFLARPSLSAAVRGALYGVRDRMERASIGALSAAPGKAMRRLDVTRGLGVPVWAGAH